jgi:hypothetical protein
MLKTGVRKIQNCSICPCGEYSFGRVYCRLLVNGNPFHPGSEIHKDCLLEDYQEGVKV